MRYVFTTDPHGSDMVFSKLCKFVRAQNADVLILAGDLIGKTVYRCIKQGTQFVIGDYLGEAQCVADSVPELERLESVLAAKGVYIAKLRPEDCCRFETDPGFRERLLLQEACNRLNRWLSALDDLARGCGSLVLISAGNDDPYEVDRLIQSKETAYLKFLGGVPFQVGPLTILTVERVNPSGLWNTARESSEADLRNLISRQVSLAQGDRNLVFNFHAPPFDTQLDLAVSVDRDLRLRVDKYEGLQTTHCGSVAVREAIATYRPKLSLHGHIHESQGFEWIEGSLCVNPGSAYQQGLLRAFVFDVKDGITPLGIYNEEAESPWRMVF